MREAGAGRKARAGDPQPLARPRPRRSPDGRPLVIRLKAPREGETVIDDAVQGRVVFANKELDDLIILRSDGTPTYNLAVVVDDHDMGDHARHPRRRSSDQCRAPDADLRRHGLGRAALRARAADPRPRRRQALQAPRRARRRGLSRDGLSAGGAAQLPGAARLEPWQRRDHVDRADDRLVRPRRHRPLAGALRLRQARGSQRPLHPGHERPGAAGAARRAAAGSRQRRRDPAAARRRHAGQAAHRACRD